MRTKTCPAMVKAVGSPDDGIVEMIVSTYAVDSWGERVKRGAFAETLAEWKARGDPIPFIWSHRSDDPEMHIGYVLEAEEREADNSVTPPLPAGLWVKAQIDMDEPKPAKVFRLLKGRRVTQASFAYDVLDAGTVTEDGEKVYELRKLKLYEVGPTLIGMNQETTLINAKALGELEADIKAGRVLSTKDEERLRSAHGTIGQVLSTLDSGGDGEAGGEPAKDEGETVKSEEPMHPPAELELLEHDLNFAAL